MPKVMVQCPATGEFVGTGIETDQNSFIFLPAINARFRCAACGQQHRWSVLEAQLDHAAFMPLPDGASSAAAMSRPSAQTPEQIPRTFAKLLDRIS
jgi:hypothetical protein